MRFRCLGVAAAALACSGQGWAQPAFQSSGQADAAAASPVPPREVLERMCNAQGAMAHAFGDTDVPFSNKLENLLGLRSPLAAHFAPFEEVEMQATPWSGRLAFVQYSIPTRGAESTAREASLIDALSRAAAEAGWRRLPEMEDFENLPLYLMGLGGERFYEVSDDGQVVASLAGGMGAVTLSCGHKALLRSNAEEALGELPAGTPRPQPPAIPAAMPFAAADCDRPEVQREMLAIVDGRASNPIARLLYRASYAERLSQWKMWRLRGSGRVSRDRLLALSMGALESGSPRGDPLAAFALFSELLDVLQRLADQTEAQQPPAACRTSFELVDVFERMEAITGAQWRAMDVALDGEARRLGVSLD